MLSSLLSLANPGLRCPSLAQERCRQSATSARSLEYVRVRLVSVPPSLLLTTSQLTATLAPLVSLSHPQRRYISPHPSTVNLDKRNVSVSG